MRPQKEIAPLTIFIILEQKFKLIGLTPQKTLLFSLLFQ